jgi:hypothetical protein
MKIFYVLLMTWPILSRATMRAWNFHIPWFMEWYFPFSIFCHGIGMESISTHIIAVRSTVD